MSDYLTSWKVEKGFYDPATLLPFPDAECDRIERVNAEREKEERGWTRAFFERMFGIRKARSGQANGGPDKETVRAAVDMVRLYAHLFPDRPAPRFANRRYVQVSCPFHGRDRLPSMSLDTEKKSWTCFSCGEHGSCFDLVMKAEGLSFPEAVEAVHRTC